METPKNMLRAHVVQTYIQVGVCVREHKRTFRICWLSLQIGVVKQKTGFRGPLWFPPPKKKKTETQSLTGLAAQVVSGVGAVEAKLPEGPEAREVVVLVA